MFSKYLNPKNDLAFKKIFGQEKRKHIPIAFLNAVFHLSGATEIVDLDFLNVVQPPEIEARKESIVDVLVRDEAGSRYVIEMQFAKVKGFEKRAQYYAAKTYCSHFNAGNDYVDLKRVIFLAITDYISFPDKKAYKSDHVLLDTETYEHDLKDFSFTFVELPKFTKKLNELQTLEEKWYYFLAHTQESEEGIMALSTDPEIREAYGILERARWTEAELLQYDKLAMAVADARGALAAAKDEGIVIGEEKGIQKEKLRMARDLYKQNFSAELIARLTGITEKDLVQ